MFRKIFAVLLVVLILFCLTSPAFAVGPEFALTEAMKQGLFWSLTHAVGIDGQPASEFSESYINSKLSDVGLYNLCKEFYQLSDVNQFFTDYWDNIKGDFRALGTVKFPTGKTVPSYSLNVTTENSPYVRKLARLVFDFWKTKSNIINDSDFVNINEEFGGYISSAEGFVGARLIVNQYESGNQLAQDHVATSYGASEGYFYLGMDLYRHVNGGIQKVLSWDSTDNSVTLYTTTFDNINVNQRYRDLKLYLYYPISLSATTELHLDININCYPKFNNSHAEIYIYEAALITAESFEDWQSATYIKDSQGTWNQHPNNFYYAAVSDLYVIRGYPSYGVRSAIIPAGDYYLMFMVDIESLSNRLIQKDTKMRLTDELVFEIPQGSVWSKERITGALPVTQWSYEIPDSGTGMGPVTGTISSQFPTILNDDTEDVPGVLYFPSFPISDISTGEPDITIPELNAIIGPTATYPATGTLTESPSVDPSGGSSEPPVNVDLTLPQSLGIGDIWHYVEDTITYCTHYMTAMFGTVMTVFPTPLTNLVWATVVLSIVFGLYRRFIE